MAYASAPNEKARMLRVGTEQTLSGEQLEYIWYSGSPGHFKGVIVVKTDRFGQRWQLQIGRGSFVTVRVAAGMLGVTPMTVTNWVRAGQFPNAKTKNRATVVPFHDIERIARGRGLQLPYAE